MRRLALAASIMALAFPLAAAAQLNANPPQQPIQPLADANAQAMGEELGACIPAKISYRTQLILAQREIDELRKQIAAAAQAKPAAPAPAPEAAPPK